MLRAAVTIAAISCASGALAQTSNCMSMGGNMAHCDNMASDGSMSSTNCTGIGGGMVTCNTMDMSGRSNGGNTSAPSPSTNAAPLGFLGDLIARADEKSFQKKVRLMLSAGDCKGADNLALSRGRYAMSSEIRRSCVDKSSPEAAGIGATKQFTPQASNNAFATPNRSSTGYQGSETSAFNLLCKGTVGTATKAGGFKETAFTKVLRVDLGSRRYCEGECSSTLPILRIESDRITLSESEHSDQILNRESGSYTASFENSVVVKITVADCEKQAFAGFPSIKF